MNLCKRLQFVLLRLYNDYVVKMKKGIDKMVTTNEIIQEFQSMLQRELTEEEINFIHWMVALQSHEESA
jgi:hypothetical protein